ADIVVVSDDVIFRAAPNRNDIFDQLVNSAGIRASPHYQRWHNIRLSQFAPSLYINRNVRCDQMKNPCHVSTQQGFDALLQRLLSRSRWWLPQSPPKWPQRLPRQFLQQRPSPAWSPASPVLPPSLLPFLPLSSD